MQRRPFAAAAIVGGAAAATAGAFLGARAIARRNRNGPLNAVLENAIHRLRSGGGVPSGGIG